MDPVGPLSAAPTAETIAFEQTLSKASSREATATELTVGSAPIDLTLGQRVRRLKVVFLLIFLLGAGSSATSANIPDLIVKTFGGNSYLVAGLFSGGKGLLACIYSPFLGALSDGKNRRWALLITSVLSVIPPALFCATSNYWVFAALDTVLGVYGPTLSLLMTCVTDYIPSTCPARTETFAMTMFFFLLGIAAGPVATMGFSPYFSFVVSAILMLLCVVVTFFLLPPAERYRDEDEKIAQSYLAEHAAARRGGSSSPARCPFLPPGRIATVVAADDSRPEEAPLMGGVQQGADEEDYLSAADSGAKKEDGAQHRAVAVVPESGASAVNTDAAGAHSDAEEDDEATPLTASVATTTAMNQRSTVETVSIAFHRMRTVFTSHRSLRLVLAIVFWSCMCQEALESSLTLYLKHRVGFTSHDFVPFIAIVALSGLLSLSIVVATLRRYFGTSTTLKLSIAGNVCFALGLAFLDRKWMAYAVCSFGILGYGVFPCSSSLVAHAVPQANAGAAQGILTAMRMLAQGIGPAVFGVIFHFTQHTDAPGAAYMVGAACGVMALITAFVVSRLVELP